MKKNNEALLNELRKECLSGHYVTRLENLAELISAEREYQAIQNIKQINHAYSCQMKGSFQLYEEISSMLYWKLKTKFRFTQKQLNSLHYAFLGMHGTKPNQEDITDEARSNG